MRVLLIALLAAISYAQTGWGLFCEDCQDYCSKYARGKNCKVRSLQSCKDYCEELDGCKVFNYMPHSKWGPGNGRCCVRSKDCNPEDRGTKRKKNTNTYVLSARGEGMCAEVIPYPSRVPHFDHDICCSEPEENCFDAEDSIYGYCFTREGGRAAVCDEYRPPECDEDELEGVIYQYGDAAVQSCKEAGCLCTQRVTDAVAHGLEFDLNCVIGNSMTVDEEAAACEARQCDATRLSEFGASYSDIVADSCDINHQWAFQDNGCHCAMALIEAIEETQTVSDIDPHCLLGTSGMTLKQASDHCDANAQLCEEGEHDYSDVCMPAVCSHDRTPIGEWHTTVIECKESTGYLCAVPWTPPTPGECCSTCRCDGLVCDPTPCPDGSDPPRLSNECCGRQELCIPACSNSAMRNAVSIYGADFVQACRRNECACYTQLLSAIDHGLEFDDTCIIESTQQNLRKTGESCGYDNGWDRIYEDETNTCGYDATNSLRGVSILECRNTCEQSANCMAFSFITEPDLPSFHDGETIFYAVNCLIYDKCMHRKIMNYRGDTYLRQADDGPSGACDMDAIKSRVSQYGQQYVDACDARTCACWTMMSAAIDFGLEFDDSCFVEDMTDSPTLADLAADCLCPLQDLVAMAGMSSMTDAAEACELQTCECFEALGEVLYQGDAYDASCWTSTYGGVSMTLAEQINHCGYSGCPPETGAQDECTSEQQGLQCYYGGNLCCCGECRREIYKTCSRRGSWMSSIFSECENPNCDCTDNWNRKTCKWVRKTKKCYLYYDDCMKTCGCDYDIEEARRENRVNDAVVDQTCDPGSHGASSGGWFQDSRGFTCDVYEYAGWCSPNGSGSDQGPNWCPRFPVERQEWRESECKVEKYIRRWGPFEEYRNENGQDARVCCCASGIQDWNPYYSGSFGDGQCNDYTFPHYTSRVSIEGDRWHDANGFSCAVYEMMNWCNADGSEGDGWDESSFGPYLKQRKTNKMRAFDACCVCGGGMTEEDLPPVYPIPDKKYEDFDKYLSEDYIQKKGVDRLTKTCRKFIARYIEGKRLYGPEEDLQLIEEMCSLMDNGLDQGVARRMRDKLHATSFFD